MKTKFIVKLAFSDYYLSEANDNDKAIDPLKPVVFKPSIQTERIVLFNSKEDALEVYNKWFGSITEQLAAIVEVITC